MLLFGFPCICELYIKCRIVYTTNKPILVELGIQDHTQWTSVTVDQHVDPRSDHMRTVRSGSMEPDAIMFCCGWVATATTTPGHPIKLSDSVRKYDSHLHVLQEFGPPHDFEDPIYKPFGLRSQKQSIFPQWHWNRPLYRTSRCDDPYMFSSSATCDSPIIWSHCHEQLRGCTWSSARIARVGWRFIRDYGMRLAVAADGHTIQHRVLQREFSSIDRLWCSISGCGCVRQINK